ncbi:MAG: dephospho-CoA kinase [Candidatus Wallbacteria bacterium]|nr:dephospho-CoA kinase [Candidatus Wallbacteria bacterium]
MTKHYFRLIGLTGQACSGKSSISEILRKKGFLIFNLDNIGHQALRNERIRNVLTAEFGTEILSAGEIDRKKLGRIVFSSSKRLSLLNQITWPWMITRITELLKLIQGELTTAFLEAAILYQGGFDKICAQTVFVRADQKLLEARLIERNGRDFAENVLKQQEMMREYEKRADYYIDNNGTLAELEKATEEMLRWLKAGDW